MSAVLEELHLSETGLLDTKATKRIGQALGSDVIVTGTLIDLNKQKTELNSRGLLVDNGRIVTASRAMLNRTWDSVSSLALEAPDKRSMNQPTDAMLVLARQICQQLSKQKKPLLLGVMNFTYAKGRISTGSDLLSERMVTYLVQNGAFVVERRLIDSYLNEIHLEETGFIDVKGKKEQNLAGVDAVVVGSLSDLSDDKTQVVVRVIDIDTAKVLATAEAVALRLWLDNPHMNRQELAGLPIPGFFAPLPASQEQMHRHRLSDMPLDDNKPRYYPTGVPFLMQGGSHTP